VAGTDPQPLTDEAAAAIVAVLHEHGVNFVVIGGFAIQLHQVGGLARTSDIDVTPERSRANLERLAAALTAATTSVACPFLASNVPSDTPPVWLLDAHRPAVAISLIIEDVE
jgi:hypothetical protein